MTISRRSRLLLAASIRNTHGKCVLVDAALQCKCRTQPTALLASCFACPTGVSIHAMKPAAAAA